MKKVKYDNQDSFDIPTWWQKVIENDVADDFDIDTQRRLKWVIEHKKDQCLKRMKEEWIPKLKAKGLESIPLDDEAFVNLVIGQPEYKNALVRRTEQLANI